MRSAPWPCSTCGAPGVRNVFASGYCPAHLAELYRTFSPAVWKLQGVGVQDGPRRPDIGPEYAELRCVACDATWVGGLFERCPWCARQLELLQRCAAETVLTPPDVDPDDRRRTFRLEAWADRLAVAVEAGTVTRDEALAVWQREVGRVAA